MHGKQCVCELFNKLNSNRCIKTKSIFSNKGIFHNVCQTKQCFCSSKNIGIQLQSIRLN